MSAAGAWAQKAEAIPSWTVDRFKDIDFRVVRVTRNAEMFSFTWGLQPNTGNYVLERGVHVVNVEHARFTESWDNLSAALRLMAEPAGHFVLGGDAGYYRLPFDSATTPDAEVLAALTGREITWRNRISGNEESAVLPHGGKQTHITAETGMRCVCFASRDGGFRAVRLSSITNVGRKVA